MVKPRLKRMARIAAVVLIALALLLVAFSVVVPYRPIPDQKGHRGPGYGPVRLLQPDVGLYRTTLANLSIGDPDHPQLELASATVRLTPQASSWPAGG